MMWPERTVNGWFELHRLTVQPVSEKYPATAP